jgi:hypothetical protein
LIGADTIGEIVVIGTQLTGAIVAHPCTTRSLRDAEGDAVIGRDDTTTMLVGKDDGRCDEEECRDNLHLFFIISEYYNQVFAYIKRFLYFYSVALFWMGDSFRLDRYLCFEILLLICSNKICSPERKFKIDNTHHIFVWIKRFLHFYSVALFWMGDSFRLDRYLCFEILLLICGNKIDYD